MSCNTFSPCVNGTRLAKVSVFWRSTLREELPVMHDDKEGVSGGLAIQGIDTGGGVNGHSRLLFAIFFCKSQVW